MHRSRYDSYSDARNQIEKSFEGGTNVERRPRSRLNACEVLRGRLARWVRGRANREKVKHVARPLRNNTMIITGLLAFICVHGVRKRVCRVGSSRRVDTCNRITETVRHRTCFTLRGFALTLTAVLEYFFTHSYTNQEELINLKHPERW
ncbi:hypothetical protein Trydic_g16222 [Trypoxylus dichotomus]